MKPSQTITFFSTLLFSLLLLLSFSGNAQATFTVTNTDNAGAGSLRSAILSANATLAYDTIVFAIPGAGPHTITLDTTNSAADELTIAWPVLIDGLSQGGSGYTGLPLIQIDCNNMTASTQIDAFQLGGSSDGTIIRGLNIIHQYGAGVVIGPNADNCIIEDCTFGVDVDGTTMMPSGFGTNGAVTLFGKKSTVRRCVLSGQNVNGILLFDPSDSSKIYDNFIGTDYTGTTAVSNTVNGIYILHNVDDVEIENNVISGNLQRGILLNGTATTGAKRIQITGNRIGTDVAGATDIPNQEGIVVLAGDEITIGGLSSADRNIISGNNVNGISLNKGQGNTIRNNYIGTDSSGMAALGNGNNGIAVFSTNAGSSINHMIGGLDPNAKNIIAFNEHHGISVYNGSANMTDSVIILGNNIHSNVGIGINLSVDDVVTLNDQDDVDNGVNELLNFPVITSVIHLTSGNTNINFDLDLPEGYYIIEVFVNPSGVDPSQHGEGEIHLLTFEQHHSTNGLQSYSIMEPTVDSTIFNYPMSMTTTRCSDMTCTSFTGTSEFSLTFTDNFLHVDFISFDAKKLDQAKVELNWSISADSEVQLFEIYRMLDEENQFKKIASLTKDQYDENQNSFRYIDLTKGFNGQAYYKIRHIDSDLKTADSDIKSIMFHQVNTKAIQVYPNPSKDFITLLHRNADEAIRYTLLNAVGNEILSGSVFPGEQIDVQALRPGIYYIQASNSINEFNSKILLLD